MVFHAIKRIRIKFGNYLRNGVTLFVPRHPDAKRGALRKIGTETKFAQRFLASRRNDASSVSVYSVLSLPNRVNDEKNNCLVAIHHSSFKLRLQPCHLGVKQRLVADERALWLAHILIG